MPVTISSVFSLCFVWDPISKQAVEASHTGTFKVRVYFRGLWGLQNLVSILLVSSWELFHVKVNKGEYNICCCFFVVVVGCFLFFIFFLN